MTATKNVGVYIGLTPVCYVLLTLATSLVIIPVARADDVGAGDPELHSETYHPIAWLWSDQLGGISGLGEPDCNYLPGGAGMGVNAGGTPYLLMGTRGEDDEAHLKAKLWFTVSPSSDFLVRLCYLDRFWVLHVVGTGSIVDDVASVHAPIDPVNVLSPPWYYLACGRDTSHDGQLQPGEITWVETSAPLRIVNAEQYADKLGFFSTLDFWNLFHLRPFSSDAFTEGFLNGNKPTHAEYDWSASIQSSNVHLEHRVGCNWKKIEPGLGGDGTIHKYGYTETNDNTGDGNVIHYLLTTNAFHTYMWKVIHAHYGVITSPFANDATLPSKHFQFRSMQKPYDKTRDNISVESDDDDDLAGLIGGGYITGVLNVDVERDADHPDVLRIANAHFYGHIDDVYDFNYDPLGGEEELAQRAAMIQAGYPTLGPKGHVMRMIYMLIDPILNVKYPSGGTTLMNGTTVESYHW